MVPTKVCLGFLKILKIEILANLFVFVKMGPYGSQILKRYSSYKLQPKVFKLVQIFPPNGPHKTSLGYLKFWVSDFLRFFFRKFQISL